MINIPKFREGDIVNISNNGVLESVVIMATTISVESQEIYYKVSLHDSKLGTEFIINEDEIITGYYSVPIPSFSVGDVISFNYAVSRENGAVDWEVREGVIETVNITWSEEGWYIYYKTDEHPVGEYVLQDDVVDADHINEELEEVNYGAV
jgi:NMD protein affecting ribosome stability and mRNA decay